MINSIEMMMALDQIRNNRKISVENLTEGIISRRNYSRYLSGEIRPPFEVVEALLKKLDVSLLNFSLYLGNHIEAANQDEIEFRDLIRLGNIEEAYEKYYTTLKNKRLKTVYNSKAIPMGLVYTEFYMNKTSKYDAISRARIIIDLESVINSLIIDDDTIEALNIYSKFADCKDKRKIISYMSNVIFSDNYKLFFSYYQQSQLLIYITALRCLTTLESVDDKDKSLIDKIFKEALAFNIKARMKIFGFLLFEVVYKFTRKFEIKNKYITYYYMMEIFITSYDSIKKKKQLLKKIDYEEFEQCIKEKEYNSETMYERILKNGIFT
jgi:transcriptional regulator with XRE-family HTH domain